MREYQDGKIGVFDRCKPRGTAPTSRNENPNNAKDIVIEVKTTDGKIIIREK